MYEYKSEIMQRAFSFITGSDKDADVSAFDDLVNRKATEGWELVSHSHMPGSIGGKNSILVSFEKSNAQYEYKSEVMQRAFNFITGSDKDADVSTFNELVNEKAAEGWKLVCHSHMPGAIGGKNSILVSFCKLK